MIIPESFKVPLRENQEQKEEKKEVEDDEEEVFPLDLGPDSEIIDYDVLEEKVPCYIVPRDNWEAVEPKEELELPHPVPDILFTYTNSDTCDGLEECVNFMKKQQKYDMEERGLRDLQHNFYIAKDWTVYEGCGWNGVPSGIQFYPRPEKIISFCYIGRYEGELYPSIQVRSILDQLLEFGIERGYVNEEFNNLPVII